MYTMTRDPDKACPKSYTERSPIQTQAIVTIKRNHTLEALIPNPNTSYSYDQKKSSGISTGRWVLGSGFGSGAVGAPRLFAAPPPRLLVGLGAGWPSRARRASRSARAVSDSRASRTDCGNSWSHGTLGGMSPILLKQGLLPIGAQGAVPTGSIDTAVAFAPTLGGAPAVGQ